MSGGPPLRRRAGPLALAVLVLAAGLALGGPGAVAEPGDPTTLDEAKDRLAWIDASIEARQARLAELEHRTQRLVARIERERDDLERLRYRRGLAGAEVAGVRAAFVAMQRRIEERARIAFMDGGPPSPMDLVFSARSFADLGFGVEVLDRFGQRDADLQRQLEWSRALLLARQAELRSLVEGERRLLQRLGVTRRRLREAFAEQRAILASLADERVQVVDLIHRLQPLWVCPVRGPHAYRSSFGMRRPPDSGKAPIHQGVDIFAPYGTPIVAPFDGRAVVSSNPMGGLAVKVFGERGFVYNAHLSRFGTLGWVSVGTVIGFVGNSGNARNTSPHDHFEWHPWNGPAVDPYPYLNQSC